MMNESDTETKASAGATIPDGDQPEVLNFKAELPAEERESQDRAQAEPATPQGTGAIETLLGMDAEPQTKLRQMRSIMSAVESGFGKLKPLMDRSQESLHKWIGCVREKAALIDADDELKFMLWEHVDKEKKLPLKWRKQAKKRPAAQTIFGLYLGLDAKTAGKRSQYYAAIRAANLEGIEPDQESFVAWLAVEGGIDGVRKYLPKRSRRNTKRPELAEIGAELSASIDENSERISLPNGLKFASGWTLILVAEPDPDEDPGEACIIPVDAEDLIREAVDRILGLKQLKEGQAEAARRTSKRRPRPEAFASFT
jgi:hypothetical protein